MLAALLLAGLARNAAADDKPKGELFVPESGIETRVEVTAQTQSSNGYAVAIKGSVSSPGKEGSAGPQAPSNPPVSGASNTDAAAPPQQANTTAGAAPARPAANVAARPASVPARPASSGAVAPAAAGQVALIPGMAGGSSGSVPGSQAGDSNTGPASARGAGSALPADGPAAPAPPVFTFQELWNRNQQTPGSAIPVGLVGTQPIYPQNTAFDNYGNVWYIPGSPSSDSPGTGPSDAAPGADLGGTQNPQTPQDTQSGPSSQSPGAPALDPREAAVEVLHEVPLPDIRVRVNPDTGLVALPAWFWVEGYNGQAFGASRSVDIPPLVGADVPVNVVPANDPRRQGQSFSVEVRVWPTQYTWSFGDGATLVSRTLGQRYPQRSDIQHSFDYSSLGTAGGFPVRLTVAFAAEFRVNGGPPQGLPPVQRTYETRYRVQEIQTVLTG